LFPPQNQVFCVGWQKTGTSSMNVALKTLGYRVYSAGVFERYKLIPALENGQSREVLKRIISDYNAIEDNPFCQMYEDLVDMYPDAKYVLTIREAQAWFNSARKHFAGHATPMTEFVYGKGKGDPAANEDWWVERYNEHNKSVTDFFAMKGVKLLTMDLTKGDGWEKLCDFLELPVPPYSFPKTNVATERDMFQYSGLVDGE
jgi:hypothetical protein